MSGTVQRLCSPAQLLPAEKFWRDLHHAQKRRKVPRVHANVPVHLSAVKGAVIEMRTNDLSYHGMQVWCDRGTAAILLPKASGDGAQPVYPIILQLDIDGISPPINAHVRIAHMTRVANAPAEKEVAIGLLFVCFEGGAQQALHRFIDQHLVPAGWT